MFVAQILVLVGGVLTVVGAVGAVFTLGLSAILLLPASLLMLVGGILEAHQGAHHRDHGADEVELGDGVPLFRQLLLAHGVEQVGLGQEQPDRAADGPPGGHGGALPGHPGAYRRPGGLPDPADLHRAGERGPPGDRRAGP